MLAKFFNIKINVIILKLSCFKNFMVEFFSIYNILNLKYKRIKQTLIFKKIINLLNAV